MAPNARKHHALAIALPAQGHINALMRFCKKLALEGFTITFVNIDPLHYRIEQLQQAAEEEEEEGSCRETQQALDIRRAHVPMEGLDLSSGSRVSFAGVFHAIDGLAPNLEKLLRGLIATADPPLTCLISDFHMTAPTSQLAHKFNLPRVVFYPFSASMLLFMDYVLQGEVSQAKVVDALRKKESISCYGGLQGLPTLNIQDLPRFSHWEDGNEFMYEVTMRDLQESKNGGHAIVVNSLEEVEEEALKALEQRMEIPVYLLGPSVDTLGEVETATSLWKEDKACMNWLDQQASHSVLYISFGSVASLSHLQFEELVASILSSKHKFLFVFRPNLVEENPNNSSSSHLQTLLSSEKGYVVEWTPQLLVLSHPSIGGFLTHCGQNSIIEALTHGVPMLCWPYFVDQFMNAKLIVEEWKVGLHLLTPSEPFSYFVTSDHMEKSIKALMEGEDGKIVRNNAKRIKEASYQSVSPSGNSFKCMQEFIQSL